MIPSLGLGHFCSFTGTAPLFPPLADLIKSRYHIPIPVVQVNILLGPTHSAVAALEANEFRSHFSARTASAIKEASLLMLNLCVNWLFCHTFVFQFCPPAHQLCDLGKVHSSL